jgi:hypothetical protein
MFLLTSFERKMIRDLIGEIAENNNGISQIDLLDIAQSFSFNVNNLENHDKIEDLTMVNRIIYNGLEHKSAWEEIAEKLLTAFKFNVPDQGKKRNSIDPNAENGEVLSFWDVERDGIFYSVKSSLNEPKSSFKQATGSSNIKFQALISMMRTYGLDKLSNVQIGNIGCIYRENKKERTISWGEITPVMTLLEAYSNIKNLIKFASKSEDEETRAISSLEEVIEGKFDENKMYDIISLLNRADLVGKDGRINTGYMPKFLGPIINKIIGSITVYHPEYFSQMIGRLSLQENCSALEINARKILLHRINSIAADGLYLDDLKQVLEQIKNIYKVNVLKNIAI